jgi:hypothetical protein
MIKYFAFSLMLFFGTSAFSQSNQTEAKAAYLLAEESYGKGDYKTALRYLELTKKSLGSSNSKMLYLWIQTEIEISKTEPGNNEKILSLIDEFEKLSDVDSFNEEKVLEITKIKLTLKTQLSDAKEKAQKEAKEKLLIEGALKAYEKNLDFHLGSSLAELKVNHPDFAKAIAEKDRGYEKSFSKARVLGGTKIFPYKEMVLSFDHDVLEQITVNKFLFTYVDPSGVKGKVEFKFFLEDFILKHGLMPKPFILEDKTSNFYSESYNLEAGGKSLSLSFSYTTNYSQCFLIYNANIIK